jgi:hypothetical protein
MVMDEGAIELEEREGMRGESRLRANSEGLTLKFPTLGGAGALVQHALDVVAEDAAVLQDPVDVDPVVLLGVLNGVSGQQEAEAEREHAVALHPGFPSLSRSEERSAVRDSRE